MFYLGQWRKGLIYLFSEVLFYVLPYAVAHLELTNLDLDIGIILFSIAIRVVGVPHCYFVSKSLHGQIPRVWYARWYSLVGVFVVAPAFVAIVLRTFLFEAFSIPSSAMLPTLRVGDYLFVSKYSYGYSRYSLPFGLPLIPGRIFSTEPERGDVAVFKSPRDNKTAFVKRIIGLPGDRIQVKGGILHINGTPVQRQRIEDFVRRHPSGRTVRIAQYVETLPSGRRHRIIEESDNARWDNTREYTVPPGHYFAMGDNRDNTLDSRMPGWVGFVPMRNLIGKLKFILWNSQERKLKFSGHD